MFMYLSGNKLLSYQQNKLFAEQQNNQTNSANHISNICNLNLYKSMNKN